MMKNPSLKRLLIFAGISLAVSGLSFYVVSALLALEQSEQNQLTFVEGIRTKLMTAQTQYASFLADGPVKVETDITGPVSSVKGQLEAIYFGNGGDHGFEIPTSEETRTFLKLALVQLDKIVESANSKTADFSKALSAFQDFSNHLAERQLAHRSIVVFSAWSLVIVIFALGGGIAFYDYRKTTKAESAILSARNQIQQETKRVEKLTGFIEAISSGNYAIDFDADDKDELNRTLLAMRDRLKKNAEEDQQRNWASAGLAQASEILRINNAQELYDTIIKFVVKYTHSNQGGLFVLSDDDQDQSLELVSCYAFERKKYLTRKIGVGQGMIGQCFLEKEKIHLMEIPEDYVNITSGLGAANPTSLLLIPLKTNDVVYGVLELASFKTYKEFEIEWTEQLAESIASTVASVRANENMRVLLEQTQQQAEEMKSQEEEMRQNMEELSATQEEMSRKEREYINRINELETLQSKASL